MKIYIDKTQTSWFDISTKDTKHSEELCFDKFTTYYRIAFLGSDIIRGSFEHYKDMTFEEKENHVKEVLKEELS